VALDGDRRFATAKWTSGQCVQVSVSERLEPHVRRYPS